jgi:hypothetical protein
MCMSIYVYTVFLKKKGSCAVLQINLEKCGSALHILSHSLRKQLRIKVANTENYKVLKGTGSYVS